MSTDCHPHVIEGEILIDGAVVPIGYVEVMCEIMCKQGKLVPRPVPEHAGTKPLDEPDGGDA